MEIFLDTANIEEIKKILPWGIISGVTTNQKLFLQGAKDANFRKRIFEIGEAVDGPLSVELTSLRYEKMLEEAHEYYRWDPEKIIIKVPMMADGTGVKLINALSRDGIRVNATVLITTSQAILASLAGATYLSLFYNRIKDSGGNPVKTINETRNILDSSGLKSKIIAGSIRKSDDVTQAAIAGAHIITVPYAILIQMPFHPKTEETIKEFDQAWRQYKGI